MWETTGCGTSGVRPRVCGGRGDGPFVTMRNPAEGYAKIGVMRPCRHHHSSFPPHERRRIHATRGGGEEEGRRVRVCFY